MIEEIYPYIKLTDCGSTALVTHCPFLPPDPKRPRIMRVNKWFYYVTTSEEFRPYREKSATKGDNLESVRRSFNRLKAIINCNYETPESVRYITLTYEENMQDNDRIRVDMRYFVRNMKRRFGVFEYLYVKEKQQRGAWHMHAVLFFSGEAPYMPNTADEHPVRDAWGHGFVNVKGFAGDINNLGNYLCAYLTDDRETSKKGARLCNYESGIRLYNCSRGVKRPVVRHLTYRDYLDFVTDENNVLISDGESVIFDSSVEPKKVAHELYVTY